MPIAVMIRLVRVEDNSLAVRGPLRAPGFELPLCNLDRFAARRWHHVEMIPAVAIAQERDPFPVGRRLGAAVGVAGHAPEFFLDVFVEYSRFAASDIHH